MKKTHTKFGTRKGALLALRHFKKTSPKFKHAVIGTTLYSVRKKEAKK